MAKKKKQSLFIVAYKGRDTANEVYKTLRGLRKQKEIKIKTAAVIYRKDNGKLKLVHKRRMNTWGGAASGGTLALLLAGVGGGAVTGQVTMAYVYDGNGNLVRQTPIGGVEVDVVGDQELPSSDCSCSGRCVERRSEIGSVVA